MKLLGIALHTGFCQGHGLMEQLCEGNEVSMHHPISMIPHLVSYLVSQFERIWIASLCKKCYVIPFYKTPYTKYTFVTCVTETEMT